MQANSGRVCQIATCGCFCASGVRARVQVTFARAPRSLPVLLRLTQAVFVRAGRRILSLVPPPPLAPPKYCGSGGYNVCAQSRASERSSVRVCESVNNPFYWHRPTKETLRRRECAVLVSPRAES